MTEPELYSAGELSLKYLGHVHSTKLVIINFTHRPVALSLKSVNRVTQLEFHTAGALSLNFTGQGVLSLNYTGRGH